MQATAEPTVDVMERRLLAWAAWRVQGMRGDGYPTRSVLDPGWMPPAPGMTPTMRTSTRSSVMERQVDDCVQGLSVRLRDALYVVYIKRMAPAQQAEALGCQPATVRARVLEAKRQVAAGLRDR